jgi:tetratricopeptide (TPR) repeat protein
MTSQPASPPAVPAPARPGRPVRRLAGWVRGNPGRTAVALLALAMFGALAAAAGVKAWGEYHLREAVRLADQHQLTQARAHLAVCLRVWPSGGRVHFLAARTARRARLFDEAEEHLRLCQKGHWDEDAVTLERTLLLTQRGDGSFEPYLRDRVERGDPDALLILEVLIQRSLDGYRLWQALWDLNQYLQRKPDDLQALLGRGKVWELLFTFADAVNDYRRAVELHPESEEARRHLAQALLVTGPPADAAEQFEELRRRHPDEPEVLLGLARCRLQLGRVDEARGLLDDLLARRPGHAAALNWRGEVAVAEGDLGAAEGWFRRAGERDPNDRQAAYNLYTCLLRLGKGDEAREARARFDRLDADLKRLDRLVQEALRRPDDPTLCCEAGVILLHHGQEQEGLRWLERGLRSDPGHVPAHRALADYYQAAGQPERAAYHRRLAQGAGGHGAPPKE